MHDTARASAVPRPGFWQIVRTAVSTARVISVESTVLVLTSHFTLKNCLAKSKMCRPAGRVAEDLSCSGHRHSLPLLEGGLHLHLEESNSAGWERGWETGAGLRACEEGGTSRMEV